MLKIALVALGGDSATGLFELAQEMAVQGHRITVYARQDEPRQRPAITLDSGVTVQYLAAGPATGLPADQLGQHVREFADGLADRWRRDRPDVAHAWFWTSGLAALAAARSQPASQSAGQRLPVVQTFASLGAAEHRHRLPEQGPAGRIRLEASIARAVSAVLAQSSEETADLAGLGVPHDTVRIVPCGVDTARFSPTGPAVRRGAHPRLLTCAPLQSGQGLETLIRALPQAPDAELVIIGGPYRRLLRSLPYYRTLAGLAASAGVRDRVIFTGRVPDGDLPAWFRSADLFVSAASYEPFGMATVQAMACGRPVVATSVGANRDAVIDGTTGLLVPPGRARLLGQRIRELLAQPVRRGAYGAAAADRASSRYSWAQISQETLTAYQHSAGQPAA
ncbi:MAG TPA: glycosyltransferase [Streptosporangiaceae bacterium]|nr:glycosyltransferase [Streptosporangiaceae bacterium]